MRQLFLLILVPLVLVPPATALRAAEPPVPATAGKSLVIEDFAAPDAIAKWRLGKGLWTVAEGALKGVEKPEDHHPAGLACQLAYHDAVIHFGFQLHGGKSAVLLLRNRFGNLCRVIFTPGKMTLVKDHPNLPPDNPEKAKVFGTAPATIVDGQWYEVTASVRGPEFTAALEGQATLQGSDPAIDVDKTEVEFMAAGDAALYRHLRVSEVLPPRKPAP